MEEMRRWFLMMLLLHKKMVPSMPGGNHNFYVSVMDRLREERDARNILELYRTIKPAPSNAAVRKALLMQDPPLVLQLPPLPHQSEKAPTAILYALTPEGEAEAKGLVASELSEPCRRLIETAIVDQDIAVTKTQRRGKPKPPK